MIFSLIGTVLPVRKIDEDYNNSGTKKKVDDEREKEANIIYFFFCLN
jgi:hypothetical protein